MKFGDEIKYVLKIDYGNWVKRDTISKKFGEVLLHFEDQAVNPNNWIGDWYVTSSTYASPYSSFTDSPFGNYQNATTSFFQLKEKIDLTNSIAPFVYFYAKWDIENNYDYCQIQGSIDQGKNWIPLCGKYTSKGKGSAEGGSQPDNQPIYEGLQQNWVYEEIDLSDFVNNEVLLRFSLKSDAGLTKDGFYFDDFKIFYNIDPNAGILNKNMEVRVYPNPSKKTTQIDFSKTIDKGQVTVFDFLGNSIYTKLISNPIDSFMLNTEQFSDGIYFIKFSNTVYNIHPIKLNIIH